MGYDSFRCKQRVVTFCCVLVHDRFIYSDYYDRLVTFFFLYSVISCEGVNIMLRFDSVLRSICYSGQSQFRVSCNPVWDILIPEFATVLIFCVDQ